MDEDMLKKKQSGGFISNHIYTWSDLVWVCRATTWILSFFPCLITVGGGV
jgi:hypothetical protein